MKSIDLALLRYPYNLDAVSSMLRLAVFGGGGGTPTTYSGTLPVVLKKVKGKILQLIRDGKCEQRNLPQGFTELQYIEGSGEQYIDTGLKGNGKTKVRVEYCWHEASSTAGTGRIFGSRTSAQSSAFAAGTSSGTTAQRIPFGCFDNQTFIVGTDAIDLGEWFTIELSVDGFFVNGIQIGDAWLDETFETPETLKLFAFENNVTLGIGIGRCRRYQRWDNGVLTQDLVSAMNDSTTEFGMYDKVSGEFFGNRGHGSFIGGRPATPSPNAPMDIWCNNGVLRFGKPIVVDSTRINAYIDQSGYWRYSEDSFSVAIPVTVGQKYKIYFTVDGQADTIDGNQNTIFRYGFRSTNTPDMTSAELTTPLSQFARTTPQDLPSVELIADEKYLIIQTGAAVSSTLWESGYICVQEQDVYPVGTPWKNLYNPATSAIGKTLNDSGEIVVLADSYLCRYTDLIPVKPSTKYAFQYTRTATGIYTRICTYDASGQFIALKYKNTDTGAGYYTTTFTTEANAAYVRMSFKYDSTGVQLEEGSAPTAYEPYQTGEMLKVSNNWFNPAEDYAVNIGKYLNSSGTWAGATGTAFLTLITKLDEGKEYTVERTINNIGSCALRITAFDSSTPSNVSGRYSVIHLGTQSETSYTFTVPTGFPYVAVYVRHSSGTATDESVISAFKVYKGTYAEQTVSVPTLLALGKKTVDTAELVEGIKRGKVGVKVFDGTERFSADLLGTVYTPISDAAKGADNAPINTHFTLDNSSTTMPDGTQRFGFGAGETISTQNYYMKHPTITTASAFKTWLADQYNAGTPVIVLYPRDPETTERFTPTTFNEYKPTISIASQNYVNPVEATIIYK